MDLQAKFTSDLNRSRVLIHSVLNKFDFSDEEKEDLFQEISLGAWRAYHTFRGDCQITTWMYRIALNRCIVFIRDSKTKIKLIAFDNILYEISDVPYSEPSLSILDTLSPIERRTIDLYIEGKSYKEISAITGEDGNRLRVRVLRIKERLKRRALQMKDI